MKNLYAVLLIAFFWLKSMHSNQLPQSPEEIDDTISLWVNRTTSYEDLKQQQIEKFDQYCAINGLDIANIPDDFKNLKGWEIISTEHIWAIGYRKHGSLCAIIKPKGLSILALSCIIHRIVTQEQETDLYQPSYFSNKKWESNKKTIITFFQEVSTDTKESSFYIQESTKIKEYYIVPNGWFTETYHIILNEQNAVPPQHYEIILNLKNFYENYKNLVNSHSTEQKTIKI